MAKGRSRQEPTGPEQMQERLQLQIAPKLLNSMNGETQHSDRRIGVEVPNSQKTLENNFSRVLDNPIFVQPQIRHTGRAELAILELLLELYIISLVQRQLPWSFLWKTAGMFLM